MPCKCSSARCSRQQEASERQPLGEVSARDQCTRVRSEKGPKFLVVPAAQAVLRLRQAGNVCPSEESGLGECVTDDELFFQFLIVGLEKSLARDVPPWCIESPTVNRN